MTPTLATSSAGSLVNFKSCVPVVLEYADIECIYVEFVGMLYTSTKAVFLSAYDLLAN